MKRTLFEYDRLDGIPAPLLQRLKAFDQSFARRNGNRFVFDWNGNRAGSHVGVISIPGLTVEILPKIDRANGQATQRSLAQQNLLYMLTLSGDIPVEERDLAGLSTQNSILDVLITIFARRLLDQLRRGVDHAYIHHEENQSLLKGKLLFSQHIRHNAAHQERVFVGFDNFVADTPLNRILKATCRRLVNLTRAETSLKLLRELLAVLDEVSDITVALHHFAAIHLTRNNERFGTLLSFCKMILLGQNPAPAAGKERTFSLLFPMEQLFEAFIAAVISRHAAYFGFERSTIHIQAAGRQEHLLRREESGRPIFLMKPDILIGQPASPQPRMILDTKWKCLKTTDQDRKNNISQSDIYQLYAYATHYRCLNNILLYPQIEGVDNSSHTLLAEERLPAQTGKTRIRIAQVNLNHDLRKHQERFRAELKSILWHSLLDTTGADHATKPV